MWIQERWQRAWQWLTPAACTLCTATLPTTGNICEPCLVSLPWLSSACEHCATPLTDAEAGLLCGRCQQQTPSFAKAHALLRYAPPIDRLIQGIKYHDRLDWAQMLGERLAESVAPFANDVDALLPVPLHRARLRSRGYNQSLELARPLLKRLRLPLLRGVARTRATAPQTSLTGDDRAHNVRNSFTTELDLRGRRIAVVDDVMTSGATADALAHCLKQAGASHVEIWVVARA